MERILFLGATCVDVIINIDHLPTTGEDLAVHQSSWQVGGCAYNASQACLPAWSALFALQSDRYWTLWQACLRYLSTTATAYADPARPKEWLLLLPCREKR